MFDAIANSVQSTTTKYFLENCTWASNKISILIRNEHCFSRWMIHRLPNLFYVLFELSEIHSKGKKEKKTTMNRILHIHSIHHHHHSHNFNCIQCSVPTWCVCIWVFSSTEKEKLTAERSKCTHIMFIKKWHSRWKTLHKRKTLLFFFDEILWPDCCTKRMSSWMCLCSQFVEFYSTGFFLSWFARSSAVRMGVKERKIVKKKKVTSTFYCVWLQSATMVSFLTNNIWTFPSDQHLSQYLCRRTSMGDFYFK